MQQLNPFPFVSMYAGRYKLIAHHARGGMAQIYLGQNIFTQEICAVKILQSSFLNDNKMKETFKKEVEIIASLNHQSILRLIETGYLKNADGIEHSAQIPYFVMPFAAGGNIFERITNNAFTLGEIIKILLPIIFALEYLHHRRLVHRDVKPANIVFSDHGDPLLSDFGITCPTTSLSDEIIDPNGTPKYIAPEQMLGKPCSASDQYSVGLIIYEMLSGGKFPYPVDNNYAKFIEVLQKQKPEQIPQVSVAINKIIFRALEKDPKHRWQSVLHLFYALQVELHAEEESRKQKQLSDLERKIKQQEHLIETLMKQNRALLSEKETRRVPALHQFQTPLGGFRETN